MITVHWAGTAQESVELANAVNRNCACTFRLGVRLTACEAHTMMVRDQRALDGLLFARRIADRLRREEHEPDCCSTRVS
jgi:hypothetical protein